MKYSRFISSHRVVALQLFVLAALVRGQSTIITTGNTVLQSPVKRFGINLGQQTSYDSAQIMKNLLYSNPGFEGGLYQSVIRCGSGTTTVCNDDDVFSGWGSGFWTGATYEFIIGAAQGQTGTITSYTAANGTVGGVFGLSGNSVAPAAGDYMIVRKSFAGDPAAGWTTTLTGLGSVSANATDLPPGTQGTQTIAITSPTAADQVILTNYFDGTPGISFVQLNGNYVLSFKAKGVYGNMNVAVNLKRYGGSVFLNQTVNLTNNWATYNLSFSGTETGSAVGTVQLTFTVPGPNVVNIDDVSLTQANSDPTNQTVFRDPVVNALKQLNPGVMRFWANQLGQSLDNFIALPFGRQRSGYSAFATESLYVSYNLPEFLQLCQAIGAEPWIVVPTTFSTAEASNLIDFLAGSTSTTYGAKRAALGQSAPWTSVFTKIHLEFGNEAWNAGFKGGSIEYAQPYGQRAQAIFAAMRGNTSYVASNFDLVLGGQATSPGRNQGIQSYCNNNDSFAIAPYMMNQVDNFATLEELFGSTFAEPEAYETNSGTAEGVANGLMLQNSQYLAASGNPKPLATYEMNLSTLAGSITQSALNSYVSSTGAGLAVVDSMLQQLRQGVLTQNMFSLTQYIEGRPDGKPVYLWGSVLDMGVTDRRRPQFLALQMANQAIGNNAVMLATNHTGANPTWNQASANSVQLNNAHYIQSFAFLGSNGYSLVVFNLNRTSSEQVTFSGANVPNGTVTIRQLTSLNLTDTNETSNLVVPTTQTGSFNSANPTTLPPFSMTVYTWAAPSSPVPLISNVAVSGITTTGATISWTTSQPTTTQVEYGTTSSYGTLTTVNSALTTTHTVPLGGLTPGTTYNFAGISTNASGVTSTSDNFTFTATPLPAPQVSAVTATSITPTSALITWTTDQPATSQVQFGPTTAYGGLTAVDSSLVTSHAVTITGLTQHTTYNYSAISTNASGSSATSANFTFATLITPAVISNVTATGITANSVTVTWTTDQPTTSQVEFGTTPSYGIYSGASNLLVTSHSISFGNLTPGTTYDYAALSTNSLGALSTSSNYTFTTIAPAPVLTSLAVSGITATSATVTWTTDQPSTSQVAYGTTSAYGLYSALNSTLSTAHSVTLTNLAPSTAYNIQALSSNGQNTTGASTGVFTTATPPTVISNVIATSISYTSAIITWTTDQPTTSQVAFGTTPALGAFSTASNALTTSHTVFLNALTPTTPYYYAVLSTNSAGNNSTSATFTFSTTASGAPVISAVTFDLTANSATIAWTTDIPSTSQVNYGTTTAYGNQSALDSSLVTSHSVVLTGLITGTLYNFNVVSTAAAAVTATSPNYSFTASLPPVISAVGVTNISNSSATITWTTDLASSSLVSFGPTTGYGSQTILDPTLVTSHTVNVTGLTPGALYNFAVTSRTGAGATANSANSTFTTLAVPAPVISNVAAWPVANTTASILWTTDQNATSQVRYGTTTSYGSVATTSGLGLYHVVPLSSLTPGTTYNYQIITANSNGTTATSGNNTFTTSGTPPPAITAVTATAITSTSATITWTTDQPSTTQVNYGTTLAYGSQSQLNPGLSTTHSVTLTGLTVGTTYNYDVVSANSVGTTGTSANFSFITTGSPAPVISSVSATSITSTSATITWTTDQTSTSLVNYGTTTAYGSQSALNSNLVTAHSVTLTGLTPGTTYNFDVASTNGSNTSVTSGNFTFATAALPPPVISSVTATSITATSATITWTTDQASNSLVNYGTTNAYGSASILSSTLVTTHSVTLTGLTPSTTYNYDVVSGYATGTPTTSANFTFATTAPAPPVISAVTATPVSPTSTTITWTTDQASNSLVNYGTTAAYGSASTLNSTLVTSHSVTLTGLTQNTTYNFDVVSGYATGTPTTSGNFTFTTGQTPPVISAVTSTSITATSATITWTTDQASTSQVSYGATPAYGSQSALNATLTTTHSVTLSGLTQGTIYNFAVISGYATGTPVTSGNFTFTTIQNPPVISAVTATSITPNSATLTWTTDQPSTSLVNYGTTTGYGSQSALNSALVTNHSVTITGLSLGTTYNFAVTSGYATGTPATSGNFTFATLTAPAPSITSVAAYPVADTTANILWATDVNTTSQVNYGTTTAYGSQTPLISNLGLYHNVPLSNLIPGTTYHYQVISTNAASVTSTSADFSFTTSGTAPILFSNVTATSITANSATITWTTNLASNSQVYYGLTPSYGILSTLSNTLVTTHSVTLTGLTAGTTYNYEVLSNTATLNGTSANFTFTTPNGAVPVISAVTATSITSTSATITWTTDQASSSQVNYGANTSYGSQSALNSSLVTTHSVTLTGLTPSSTYNFDVVSVNASNTSATSGNFTFATTAAPAPVISAVTATSITSTSATITWTTDQASNSQVNYGTTTAYGSQSALNSSLITAHSVTLTGLTPGTTYNFNVVSANSANTSATSSNFTFATSAAAAPVISAVTASSITTTSATITWTTDQASSSQVNYGTTTAYGSQSALNSSLVTTHSITLTGLTPGTTYNFDVVSANASNASATSGNFTFSTTAAPAPVISAVTASNMTTTSATITWTTDQASSSQVNYGTTTSYGSQTPNNTTLVTAHSVTLSGLNPGTAYNFDVVSANASNTSATSGNFTFSTSASSTPGPVLSSVAAYPVANTTAGILWTTDQNSTSVVNYGTTTAYGQQASLGAAMTIYHNVPLSGLTPGTTYNFQVVSTNTSGVASSSGNFTFTTSGTAPAAGPVITSVTASAITDTTATITWTTDQLSNSQVSYGLTNAYGSLSTLNTTLTTSHTVTLTGLTPGATYNYQALSTNATAITSASLNFTFTTTGSTPAPVVSAVVSWGITGSSAVISWSTDQQSNTFVTYGTTPALGQTSPVQTALSASHGVTLTGLQPNTTYYFVANSTNVSGANGSSTQYSFTTLNSGAPVVLSQVATPLTGNTATVAWTLSKVGTCQVEFGSDTNYGRWSPLTTALQTSLGYVPSGTIHYVIHCMDSVGNASVSSDFTFIEP